MGGKTATEERRLARALIHFDPQAFRSAWDAQGVGVWRHYFEQPEVVAFVLFQLNSDGISL
jgi:hypothetical protein